MKDLTLIIPTRDRQTRLNSLLDHLGRFSSPPKIIVADSSKSPRNISQQNNFNGDHHLFAHEVDVFDKIRAVILSCDTKYVSLCADDDYVFEKGLLDCLTFLRDEKHHVACHGQYWSYYLGHKTKPIFFPRYISNSIEQKYRKQRVLATLDNYVPTFYAVHQTKILQNIWQAANENTDIHPAFVEHILGLLTVCSGKVKRLETPYYAKEFLLPKRLFGRHRTLYDSLESEAFEDHTRFFARSLQKLNLPNEELEEQLNSIVECHYKTTLLNKRKHYKADFFAGLKKTIRWRANKQLIKQTDTEDIKQLKLLSYHIENHFKRSLPTRIYLIFLHIVCVIFQKFFVLVRIYRKLGKI